MLLKWSLVLLSLFLHGCNNEQDEYAQEKFSYPLCTQIPPNGCFAGTAFYLRYKSKVYLTSALHSFSGINQFKGTLIDGLTNPPETIRVTDAFEYAKTGKAKDYYYQLRNDGGKVYYIASNSRFDLALLPIADKIPRNVIDYDERWAMDSVNINDEIFYFSGTSSNSMVKAADFLKDLMEESITLPTPPLKQKCFLNTVHRAHLFTN